MEPVAEEDPALGQDGLDDLLHQLRPAGLVEKQLRQGVHPGVLAVQEKAPDLIPDGRPPGIGV